MTDPDTTAAHLANPVVLDLFVRALVNEVDYDIHKTTECGEEDGLDHYPEVVAKAAEMLAAIVAGQADPEFPTTWAGGHALVIEYGDCEMYGRCQCGERFGMNTPDKPLDRFAGPWERHVMHRPTT